MSVIELDDTTASVTVKMAQGNPGAMQVILRIFQEGAAIDPDNAIGSIGTILHLDTFEIYSHRIWMLYKDVCKENLVNMISIVRAVQLGLITKDVMNHAIDNRGDGIDLDETLKKVQEKLPDFAKKSLAEDT